MSTWAVYQPRQLYINSNQNLKRKHFWTTQPCRPGRCLNREQQSKNISGPAVYHQRGIAVYHQQSKTQAKALLDDTAVSTRAMYQPRSAKQKHLWRSCISPAWYSCISTAIKIESESTSGRHSHVDQGGINRDQQSKNISGAKCVSPAWNINRDQQSESISELSINSHKNLWRKHFWTTQPCRPVRCINRNQQSKSISGEARYSCISTAIKN